MERAEMTATPNKKTRPTRRAAETEPAASASRRKKAEFTVPIKLWVSPETYAELEAEAEERDWSVPQVIRRRIRELARSK
jgi:hypothetical protein